MAYQDKRSYVPSRENKNREIKKALTHRARLRKNYFKLLDKEGQPVPLPEPAAEEHKQKKFDYAERAKIAKERKEQARRAKLEEVQERRRTIERKTKERELRKDRVTKTTKRGQPLMGPRINNLLDKIRKDLP